MKLQWLNMPIVFGLAANSMAATAPGAPTNVTAISWPYTALISFTPPTNSGGAAITSYTVTAVGAGWIAGTAPMSPIMVQGGPEQWSGVTYQFTVTATNSAGTSPSSAPSNALGCTGGTSANVYSSGVFYWEGDYDYSATSSYADTTGHPVNGPYDVMVTCQGGGWQPWSPGSNFDLTGYAYLEMDLKPTTDNKTWSVYFEKVGDISVNAQANLPSDANGTYGLAPVKGQWTTYKIPLKNVNVGPGTANVNIYKFCIKDLAQIGTNVWYANNVKFAAATPVVDNQVASVASVNRSMIASVDNRTINFAVKNTGTVTVYDLVGNRLAALHSTQTGLLWVAPSSGADLVRFEGNGTFETQRILVR